MARPKSTRTPEEKRSAHAAVERRRKAARRAGIGPMPNKCTVMTARRILVLNSASRGISTRDNPGTSMTSARPGQNTGRSNYNSRLDDDEVLAIYWDKRTQAVIARAYGINQSTVSGIKNGRQHSWLTGHPKLAKKMPQADESLGQCCS